MSDSCTILQGDWIERLKHLQDESVQCCVTSPPYWGLRDYGVAGQLGLEKTPEEYVSKLVEGFREVRRALRDDGTLWLNLGDSYAGSGMTGGTNSKEGTPSRAGRMFNGNRRDTVHGLKQKDLIGIPWRVALALQADGWYLRSDIIWHKPNPMPESVTDRPTKAHEYIFLLTKSERYFYDAGAIKEPAIAGDNGSSFVSDYDQETKPGLGKQPRNRLISWAERKANGEGNRRGYSQNGASNIGDNSGLRNKRSVWSVTSEPYNGAHFATFPTDLIKPCILAGSRPGDTVLDPFGGSGTTGKVALELGRKAILIELNPAYVELIKQRTNVTPGLQLA